jgi:hypothetical protein
MKYFAFLSALVLGLLNTQAGGFGGPPPFTNGSPLASGVDGTYQASVRGKNLSGIIRFTYSGGVQDVFSTNGNSWFIFFEGQVFSGGTEVAINNGGISGVLEAGTFPTFPNSSNVTENLITGEFSSIQVQAVTGVAGYFNGSIDNNSPNGAFSAKGELSYILRTQIATFDPNTGEDVSSISNEEVSVKIKVKGVRVTFS